MKIKKSFKFINLFVLFALVMVAGFGCKTPSQETQDKLKPITLNYWRVWEDEDAFTEIIADYQALHPNIKINYRKFRYDEYENALLEAMAEDRGPDIFSINQNWLLKYEPKIAPMPEKITMAYQTIQGTIKKEVVYQLKTTNTPTARQIKQDYADIVYDNTSINNQVYGLPLSLETLVMFYNKDILNQAGISTIPTAWSGSGDNSLQTAVQKIVLFDSKENIIRAGAALGTGSNVERMFDILSVLMMQNNTTMTNTEGYPLFFNTKDKLNPGTDAALFYANFASPSKSVYTWNATMPNSIDALAAGQVAFVFGYNYHLPTIRAKAPRLNLGIAPIPQVNSNAPVNFANYWLETVSKKSAYTDEAWDFIIFASKKEEVKKYLDKTKRPTALKSLINEQFEDEDLNAASQQTLTAKNWYRGINPLAAEQAIKEMADNLIKAATENELKNIFSITIQKINQTIK